MNKMFTSVAIAQLAQHGRLKFEDTVAQHLPDYPNKEAAEKITTIICSRTRAGWALTGAMTSCSERASLWSVSDHLPLFAHTPLSFSPGAQFQYSNAGFTLLGAIIENVLGHWRLVRDFGELGHVSGDRPYRCHPDESRARTMPVLLKLRSLIPPS